MLKECHRNSIMPACYCKYARCDGQVVDKNTKRKHERLDIAQSYHDRAEVCHYSSLVGYARLNLIQHNTKGLDISICVQRHPPDMVPRSSTQNDELGASCSLKQSQEHPRPHQTSTLGRILIPTSDPKLMGSLVRLEQNVMSQRKAMLAFKNQALASQPTKALLNKIKAH